MAKKKQLFNRCERVDRISGIGKYGVLLIGVGDSNELSKPVRQDSLNSFDDILYFRPYNQDHVEISEWENDDKNPRYGLPKMYSITTGAGLNERKGNTNNVHWTRLIHVAEEKDENEIEGTPRLQNVFNRLVDLEKIVGSSGEAYFRMVTDKILFDLDQNVSLTDDEKDNFQEQVDELIHGFRNYMRTRGVDVKKIETDMTDPKGAFDVVINTICATTGYPRKFLLGSERGEITSSMDIFTFFDSMQVRRKKFAEREILDALLDRFEYYGIIDDSYSYEWNWKPLYELSPKEKADISESLGNAIESIGKSELLGDLLSNEEARKIIGFEGGYSAIAESVIEDMKENNPKAYKKIMKLGQKVDSDPISVTSYLSQFTNNFSKMIKY